MHEPRAMHLQHGVAGVIAGSKMDGTVYELPVMLPIFQHALILIFSAALGWT